jgi:hypothetical protein
MSLSYRTAGLHSPVLDLSHGCTCRSHSMSFHGVLTHLAAGPHQVLVISGNLGRPAAAMALRQLGCIQAVSQSFAALLMITHSTGRHPLLLVTWLLSPIYCHLSGCPAPQPAEPPPLVLLHLLPFLYFYGV